MKSLAAIEIDSSFSDLGLDSLSYVELRNKLQTSLEIKLSATAIFDYPTISSIADYIYDILIPDSPANPQVNTENSLNATEIDRLSEAEAEALLLEELERLEH